MSEKLVAGPRLAQQALSNIQIESALYSYRDEEEREAMLERRKAIRHVLETGTVYQPLAEKHRVYL